MHRLLQEREFKNAIRRCTKPKVITVGLFACSIARSHLENASCIDKDKCWREKNSLDEEMILSYPPCTSCRHKIVLQEDTSPPVTTLPLCPRRTPVHRSLLYLFVLGGHQSTGHYSTSLSLEDTSPLVTTLPLCPRRTPVHRSLLYLFVLGGHQSTGHYSTSLS